MSDVRREQPGHVPRLLLHPATLLLILSDVLPIIGVLAWNWDAFLILALYWMETGVIGFWAILRVATVSEGRGSGTGPGLALFFVFHAGMFMLVHFIFLWALFSGKWAQQVHGPGDFFAQVVVATGLWLPLTVLFLSRGLWFYCQLTGWNPVQSLERMLWGHATTPPQPIIDTGTIMIRFYVRIIGMQFAIIGGGFLALKIGSMAPLVILIALKTLFDLVTGAADLHDRKIEIAARFR